jgi:Rieske Fe-S protein
VFRDPCHASTYDYEGRWLSGHHGPQPMRRYDVSLVNGNVIVDTSSYLCGYGDVDAPDPCSRRVSPFIIVN